MAYSAIEKMRKKNRQIYGRDVGPMQPALSAGAATGSDLKSAALRFLHERCEGLLFDRQIEEEEDRTGLYRGVGLGPDQIPYNMQMDINRLCLERELEKFMDSAATQDAYTVFYCFLEIFFGNYGQYKKQVEMLSEYESNGSSLLMKHRDHYSHSVFVFALGAILLHYDLYTYSIASSEDGTKPKLSMDMHPLAWLLLLCDELQCWDRTAYGRNSRKELHPMAVEFDFSKNRILARYLYDEKEQDKIDTYLWAYVKWKQNGKRGSRPKLKAYSEMANDEKSFVRNIEQIVDTGTAPITVVCDTAPVNRGNKHIYLSNSSFLHIHDFAAALNARYALSGDEDDMDRSVMEKDFSTLSLEYKLSLINQVKSFGRYLNEIHCFYTDRQVDFDMLEAFTPEQILRFAPLEHERWLREHQSMGWRNGNFYERVPAPPGADEKTFRAALREQTRCHRLVMDGELTKERIIAHYQEHLSEYEKQKNYQPFNRMLKLMRKFDGVRIYQYYT